MAEVFLSRFFVYVVIIISAIFHEYAHGWVAFRLGDPTAKMAGRLSFNPLVHMDLLGTVILPLFLLFTSGAFIGWAKPVPYNPFLLKDRRFGSLKVGIAGPLANLVLALVFGLFLRILLNSSIISGVFSLFSTLPFLVGLFVYINIFLALFNLIPIPPLDGSKIVMDLLPSSRFFIMQTSFIGIFLALILAIFFLSPLAQYIFYLFSGQPFSILFDF